MNKRMFVIFVSIFLGCLSFAQQRDSIVRVGTCATPGHPRDVVTLNIYSNVADGGGLALIDVSVPTNPTITAYNNSIFMEADGVHIKDTLAFINRGGGATFTIAVVKPPDTITRIGYRSCVMSIYPLPWGVGVRDTVGFMAGGDLGLWIFNISDLTNPTFIDTFNTPGHLLDFFIKDTLLYAADRDSLLIFNITDPASISLIGTFPVPEGVYDVFVDSIYAYLTCRSIFGTDGRMKIVNVSNPTNPELLGEGLFNGDGRGIFIANGYAYIAAADFWFPSKGKERQVGGLRPAWAFNMRADVEGGLRIVDISDPLNPTLVASYDTPGDPRGVFAVDTLVFIADYDSLQILKHVITGIKEISGKRYTVDLRLQIQPNPFRHTTRIYYQLPTSGQVTLEILDITGRYIKVLYTGYQKTGKYEVLWDGRDQAGKQVVCGVYFLHLTTESKVLFKKILVLK